MNIRKSKISWVSAKKSFLIFILASCFTWGAVYFLSFKTLETYALLVSLCLAFVMFTCTFLALYKGVKLRHDAGLLTDYKKVIHIQPQVDIGDFSGFGEDILSALLGGLIMLILVFVGAFLLSWIISLIWLIILVLFFAFYWMFYYGFRLILKNSPRCRGSLKKSLVTSTYYSLIYAGGFYLVIWLLMYIVN